MCISWYTRNLNQNISYLARYPNPRLPAHTAKYLVEHYMVENRIFLL